LFFQSEQCFSLTTNHRTVLLVMDFQRNKRTYCTIADKFKGTERVYYVHTGNIYQRGKNGGSGLVSIHPCVDWWARLPLAGRGIKTHQVVAVAPSISISKRTRSVRMQPPFVQIITEEEKSISQWLPKNVQKPQRSDKSVYNTPMHSFWIPSNQMGDYIYEYK
jgi:hypothetical protein